MSRVLARNSITLSFERDIVSVVRYYKLQASTAAAPTKPNANAALPSGWVPTEQTYIEGSTNSLYTMEKTTFSDGTWDYSDVSLSSSYEAAKAAYNRAVAAQDSVDGMEIGGRNLILDTAQTRISPASASGSVFIAPTPTLSDYAMSILNNVTDTFTYSFDYEVTGNVASGAYIYAQIKGTSVSGSAPGATSYVIDAPVGKYSCTFNLTSVQASATTNGAGIRLRYGTDGAILTVKNIKLERGNKATDWSPAPEDIVAESVDSIQVGGRNLYAVCNEAEGYIASGGTIITPTDANERTSGYIPVSVGYRYVLQSWVASISTDNRSWIAYQFYSDTSGTKVGSRMAKYSDYGGTYLCYDDITVPEGAAYIRVSYRHYEDGYCKLEIGNKPTDWTPAPEDVTNYTDETVDASQVMMAKQNLSPFFSYTPYTSGFYWRSISNTATSGYTITSMGDGWIRVQKDNTSGSSNSYQGFVPFNNNLIKPGTDYTFLFEFRNNNSTGTGFANSFYIVQLANAQFWGAAIKKNLSGARTTANVNLIADFPPGTSGVYEKRFVKASEPTGSSHWTDTLNSLLLVRAGCAVGDTLDCEIRMSLYEGEYTGPYKPYNVDIADFASVKTTANGKNKVVYSTTQPSGVFVAGDTWFNTSTSGADAGKISRYNGSQWVAQEIGSASILANEALMNKLFAYDITAANCIKTPILIDDPEDPDGYNGTITTVGGVTRYDNDNTQGSIINLKDGKINIGGSLKYDSTNGLVLDGNLTAANGTITGATLVGSEITGDEINISSFNSHDLVEFNSTGITANDSIFLVGRTVRTNSNDTIKDYISRIRFGDYEFGSIDIESLLQSNNSTLYKSHIRLQKNKIELEADDIVLSSRVQSGVPAYIAISDRDIIVNCDPYVTNTFTVFDGNVVSNSTVVVVMKLGWCQVFGALKPTSSASDFVTILDSTKVPAPQHGVAIYEQSQYWDNGYTIPLRIRINASGGLDICKGYVGGSYGFSITYPIQ